MQVVRKCQTPGLNNGIHYTYIIEEMDGPEGMAVFDRLQKSKRTLTPPTQDSPKHTKFETVD